MEKTRRAFLRACGACLLAGFGGAAAALVGRRPRAWGRQTGGGDAGSPGGVAGGDPAAFEPGYLALHRDATLAGRAASLYALMEGCRLCPRECGADRPGGEKGFCGAAADLVISSHHPHFGEEKPLVGSGGSGTIFFSHCSLRCIYCINWEISHEGRGSIAEVEDLAAMMLELQKVGCVNINVVTPSHYSAHIVHALDIAAGRGLRLPLVWNTHGWERLEVLRLLDGVVDIYLPDFKYWDPLAARRYSAGAASYPEVTKEALLEMNRQVGTAHPGPDGLIRRGLMIRHLVLPLNASGGRHIMRWIGENLPHDTYVNLMSQYQPAYKATRFKTLSNTLRRSNFEHVIEAAREAGLVNLDIQPMPLRR